jgi:threonine dehydrogenase-like Zn-dependent dehydrogenase
MAKRSSKTICVQEVGETAAKKFKKGDRVAVDPNR